jgi:hypothetical protein
MRFEGMSGRVEKLEAVVYGGRIATTDGTGRRVWVTGSGLRTAFQILKIQHDSGEENLSPDALPPALREEAFLWSRAEAEGHDQAAAMAKGLCIQIMMARGGMIDEGGH